MKKILYYIQITLLVLVLVLPRSGHAALLPVGDISADNLHNTVRVIAKVSKQELIRVDTYAVLPATEVLPKTTSQCQESTASSQPMGLQNLFTINLNQSANCFSAVSVGAVQAQQQLSVALLAKYAPTISVVVLGIISSPYILPYRANGLPNVPFTRSLVVGITGVYILLKKIKPVFRKAQLEQFITMKNLETVMLRC